MANVPAMFSLRDTSRRLLIAFNLAGAAACTIVGPTAPGQVVVRHHTPLPDSKTASFGQKERNTAKSAQYCVVMKHTGVRDELCGAPRTRSST